MSFKVTVLPSQHEFTVKDGETVLDAALEAGIMIPYSCRNGTCSTCRGRVVAGDWDAGEAPAHILEADELAQGHTLLCQARPYSDLIVEVEVVRLADDIEVRKMPSRVIAIEDLTDDVRLIRLQLPASQPLRYNPGQYLDVLLRDGRRRSYSMANRPNEANQVDLHVRHMPGGVFTDHVFSVAAKGLRLREILRVQGPLGSFFLREDSVQPIILLASGTGFAPIKAMIEDMIAKHVRRPIRLYWGVRRPKDLYMHELARSWQDQLVDFRYIPVVSDALASDVWDGRTGLVHHAVMHDIADLSDWQVYACGAPAMVESARRDFTEVKGLPDAAFFADAFTSEADLVV